MEKPHVNVLQIFSPYIQHFYFIAKVIVFELVSHKIQEKYLSALKNKIRWLHYFDLL